MSVKHLNNANFDAVVNEDKVTLVDFWAAWCGPCRMLAPTIEKLAQQYDGRANIAKVNIDEEKDLASRFGIMSIPTVVVFKGGKILEKVVGLNPIGKYTELLDKAL